jgi:hypothetical protein
LSWAAINFSILTLAINFLWLKQSYTTQKTKTCIPFPNMIFFLTHYSVFIFVKALWLLFFFLHSFLL